MAKIKECPFCGNQELIEITPQTLWGPFVDECFAGDNYVVLCSTIEGGCGACMEVCKNTL